LCALKCFLNAKVLVRALESKTEVVVVTVWDSIDSIKAFAGEDYDEPVIEPVV
jgi:heme-degrading monooxygenase HmoA